MAEASKNDLRIVEADGEWVGNAEAAIQVLIDTNVYPVRSFFSAVDSNCA